MTEIPAFKSFLEKIAWTFDSLGYIKKHKDDHRKPFPTNLLQVLSQRVQNF